MKKIIFLIAGAIILSLSCKKQTEEAIDCVLELTFATLTYTTNPDDPKEITLTVNYAGGYAVTIVWEFGDGTTQTTSTLTVTHIYSSAGTYDAKANITLSAPDKTSCSVSKSKTVNVY